MKNHKIWGIMISVKWAILEQTLRLFFLPGGNLRGRSKVAFLFVYFCIDIKERKPPPGVRWEVSR